MEYHSPRFELFVGYDDDDDNDDDDDDDDDGVDDDGGVDDDDLGDTMSPTITMILAMAMAISRVWQAKTVLAGFIEF